MRVGMDRRTSRVGVGVALGAVVVVVSAACGCARKAPPAEVAPAPSSSSSSSASSSSAADAAAPVDAAVERPFATTKFEATQLIDNAIDTRSAELAKCVEAARGRAKHSHAKFSLDIGIDQEGALLGVKIPKGAPGDDALVACALAALRDAPFPRSHAGVVTVKRTFEEVTVYR